MLFLSTTIAANTTPITITSEEIWRVTADNQARFKTLGIKPSSINTSA